MRLPISGFGVSFRLPDGRDELAILEAGRAANRSREDEEAQAAILEGALDALARLAELTSGSSEGAVASLTSTSSAVSWAHLTITDFEAALLGLRRFLFGDSVLSVVRCACTERMEIEFSISHLLGDAQPRIPRRRVTPSVSRPNWFELHTRQQVHNQTRRHADNLLQGSFRLPTVSDQILALRSPYPYAFLKQQCIEAPPSVHRSSLSIERAMEAMSPAISRSIEGVCAACGATLSAQLHVPSLVLHELRASAAHIYREVHTIATAYHWEEAAILDIPQLRRQAYADSIRQAGVQ
jgi:hypothetical protein